MATVKTKRYSHAFDPPSLKTAMEKLAKRNGRSLAQEINQACKAHVTKEKER